jgi:hypothetical protein
MFAILMWPVEAWLAADFTIWPWRRDRLSGRVGGIHGPAGLLSWWPGYVWLASRGEGLQVGDAVVIWVAQGQLAARRSRGRRPR